MYRYIIGEDHYDDYHEWELWHERKFTEEEFQEMCKVAEQKFINEDNHYSGAALILAHLINKHGFQTDQFERSGYYYYDLFKW